MKSRSRLRLFDLLNCRLGFGSSSPPLARNEHRKKGYNSNLTLTISPQFRRRNLLSQITGSHSISSKVLRCLAARPLHSTRHPVHVDVGKKKVREVSGGEINSPTGSWKWWGGQQGNNNRARGYRFSAMRDPKTDSKVLIILRPSFVSSCSVNLKLYTSLLSLAWLCFFFHLFGP